MRNVREPRPHGISAPPYPPSSPLRFFAARAGMSVAKAGRAERPSRRQGEDEPYEVRRMMANDSPRGGRKAETREAGTETLRMSGASAGEGASGRIDT